MVVAWWKEDAWGERLGLLYFFVILACFRFNLSKDGFHNPLFFGSLHAKLVLLCCGTMLIKFSISKDAFGFFLIFSTTAFPRVQASEKAFLLLITTGSMVRWCYPFLIEFPELSYFHGLLRLPYWEKRRPVVTNSNRALIFLKYCLDHILALLLFISEDILLERLIDPISEFVSQYPCLIIWGYSVLPCLGLSILWLPQRNSLSQACSWLFPSF